MDHIIEAHTMRTKPPAFLTFTGVDEWTDLGRLRALSDRYPLEWGILFSPRLQGDHPRYPSLHAVGRITHALDRKVGLAAHLCGGHASSVLAEARCTAIESWVTGGFGRFQVNTSDPLADPAMVAEFAGSHGALGIMQCRGSFPPDDRVAWLFDASGGRGVVPAAWPEPPRDGRLAGYAGGIGPGSVSEALRCIGSRHGLGQACWMDMETGIRTDDRLDLAMCEAVCRAVYDDATSPD